MNELAVWQGINDTIKWSRLYGGAIGVMLIDGQKLRQAAADRDRRQGPVQGRLRPGPVDDQPVPQRPGDQQLGPDLGEPKFYDVVVDGGPLPRQRIHHSRVIRLEGLPQPYWRKIARTAGASASSSRSTTASSRSTPPPTARRSWSTRPTCARMKVKGLREIIAAGGKAMEAWPSRST
jgi:hypothetical protein